jgi:hypothetical protein
MENTNRASAWAFSLWFALAAAASVVFLATTNQLCQDFAVVPLLWIVPMSIYLLPFILCFEHPRWYARNWFHGAFVLSLCAGVLRSFRRSPRQYFHSSWHLPDSSLRSVHGLPRRTRSRQTGRSLFDRLLPRGCRRRCPRWHFLPACLRRACSPDFGNTNSDCLCRRFCCC